MIDLPLNVTNKIEQFTTGRNTHKPIIFHWLSLKLFFILTSSWLNWFNFDSMRIKLSLNFYHLSKPFTTDDTIIIYTNGWVLIVMLIIDNMKTVFTLNQTKKKLNTINCINSQGKFLKYKKIKLLYQQSILSFIRIYMLVNSWHFKLCSQLDTFNWLLL